MHGTVTCGCVSEIFDRWIFNTRKFSCVEIYPLYGSSMNLEIRKENCTYTYMYMYMYIIHVMSNITVYNGMSDITVYNVMDFVFQLFNDLLELKLNISCLSNPPGNDGTPVGQGCFGIVYHKLLNVSCHFTTV